MFLLVPSLEEKDIASRWTETEDRLEVTILTEGGDPHDVALELLVCLGPALSERAASDERTGWLALRSAAGTRYIRHPAWRVLGELDTFDGRKL